uniref:ribosomal protein L18 n=1 Tax=Gloiopeltis furcata TaxID=42017 RepID=UPI0028D779F7|nr:ribosomal protein L18 [Gloiopeltis furcata]WMP13937.1 ribosomal protein L18 [Gloiopeltis furcata]
MKNKLKGTSTRPRLYIFRSNKHIYAQIIDDEKKKILASSSSISNKLDLKTKSSTNCKISKLIGKDIAEKAITKGIKSVVFDRGQRIYHGRIKALANGARETGIYF